jgi:hypothetical protein
VGEWLIRRADVPAGSYLFDSPVASF